MILQPGDLFATQRLMSAPKTIANGLIRRLTLLMRCLAAQTKKQMIEAYYDTRNFASPDTLETDWRFAFTKTKESNDTKRMTLTTSKSSPSCEHFTSVLFCSTQRRPAVLRLGLEREEAILGNTNPGARHRGRLRRYEWQPGGYTTLLKLGLNFREALKPKCIIPKIWSHWLYLFRMLGQ